MSRYFSLERYLQNDICYFMPSDDDDIQNEIILYDWCVKFFVIPNILTNYCPTFLYRNVKVVDENSLFSPNFVIKHYYTSIFPSYPGCTYVILIFNK